MTNGGPSTERPINSMLLEDILREVDGSPSSYARASRIISEGEFGQLAPVNVAVLSTFTFDLVGPFLVVESARRGMRVNPFFAPFNQLEQQVLDKGSALYQSDPGVVVIASRIDEIAPPLVERFVSLGQEDVVTEIANVTERVRGLIKGIRQHSQATVLVFNFAPPSYLSAGLADTGLGMSQTSAIQQANDQLAQVCRSETGAFVFDYARLVTESGQRNWQDPKLWYLGRVPMGSNAQLKTGKSLSRYIRAARFPASKCLVVDLDNTMWGGVIGEDGVGGIALGEEFPGSVYKSFQRRLLSLRDQGILLAIASKNNESDVLEVFEKHSDCVLSLDDFAARQIHWNDKASSLRGIAEELNISTDALAFFDDSPVEREWVRSQMPEVTVIDVPEDPMGYADTLENSGAFDNLSISQEDLQRPDMYRQEAQRRDLQKVQQSPEEFFKQLEMSATIGFLDQDTLPRVAQLMAKTNQFNLTNRRHTAQDLQAMTETGGLGLWMRLTDRFGDNGLIAVAVAVSESACQWKIDTFLMSCRVAGRKVESAFLGVLCGIVQQKGGQSVMGEYISTAKNGMVSQFYQDHGFHGVDDEGKLWHWDFSDGALPVPEFISVNIEGDDSSGG